MGRQCSTCTDPRRDAIERALTSGLPPASVAEKYPPLVKISVQRHARNHMAASSVQPAAVAEVSAAVGELATAYDESTSLETADDVRIEARRLYAKCWKLLSDAEAAGNHKTALAALREAKATLELLGRSFAMFSDGAPSFTLDMRKIVIESPPSPEVMREYVRAFRAGEPVPDLSASIATSK